MLVCRIADNNGKDTIIQQKKGIMITACSKWQKKNQFAITNWLDM